MGDVAMTDVRLRRLHAWLGDHNGVVTRRDLLAMGFTNKAIRWLLASERLVSEWYGIYRCPTYPFGRPQVMTAVCLHLPQAAIGFTTAGQELRFRGMGDEHIHTLVPHGDTPTFEGVVVHRCRRIDEIDLAGRRRDG